MEHHQHEPAFKAIVLAHIEAHLMPSEWQRLRSLCTRPGPYPSDCRPNVHATPRQLVDDAVSEDGLSIQELSTALGQGTVVGEIAGTPVSYFDGYGVYAWGASPDARCTLSLWVAHPAYPPGW